MARIPEIEARLLRWAEWRKVGDGSGYPVKCVLHEDWSPPSSGTTPSMKVVPASDVKQTGRAVARLSSRLQSGAELKCQPDTVHARIEQAHRELSQLLGA
jgi:hypothetical protein